MRRVKFDWYDRLKLVPNDIIYNMRYLLSLLIVISVLSGINTTGINPTSTQEYRPDCKDHCSGIYCRNSYYSITSPYIPTQNFSFKGLIIGVIVSVLLFLNISWWESHNESRWNTLYLKFFFIPRYEFYRRSTYTSLAGVKKEMRIAVPVQIIFASLAVILFILEITSKENSFMERLRYFSDVLTLELIQEKCNNCGMCVKVCRTKSLNWKTKKYVLSAVILHGMRCVQKKLARREQLYWMLVMDADALRELFKVLLMVRHQHAEGRQMKHAAIKINCRVLYRVRPFRISML